MSSRFGHYFDHIFDLIHPPVWYILWGSGLKASQFNMMGISPDAAFWLIAAVYSSGSWSLIGYKLIFHVLIAANLDSSTLCL
jgi:hypothetical protein